MIFGSKTNEKIEMGVGHNTTLIYTNKLLKFKETFIFPD